MAKNAYKPVTIRNPKTGQLWRTESKTQEVDYIARGWVYDQPRSKQDKTPANKAVKPDNK